MPGRPAKQVEVTQPVTEVVGATDARLEAFQQSVQGEHHMFTKRRPRL
jgi:hypothetical protein